MHTDSTPDYKQLYEMVAALTDRLRRVAQGLCPNCGAEREDNDCRACGHWSIYGPPFMPPSQESPNT